jgi:hypothetical protein
MTINITDSIKKTLGWCQNAGALAAKRVLVALPAGEEFYTDEKGKGGMNVSKMGWGNKYRNIILLFSFLSYIVFFGSIIFFWPDFFEYLLMLSFMKKSLIIIISFIIAAIFSAGFWRELNKINEGKYSNKKPDSKPNRKEIVLWIVIWILFLVVMRQIYFMRIDIPFADILLAVMMTGGLYSIVNYLVIVIWEWKNKKRIYLVEKESCGWQPVALTDEI